MSGSNGLPKGWIYVRMDQVCDKIQDGTHFSPSKEKQLAAGKYPYVTAKNVRSWGMDMGDITYLAEEVHRVIYNRCDPKPGDVLLVKDGVNAGDAAINTVEGEISLLSSVTMLRPKAGVLANHFLRYYLLSPQGRRSLLGQLTGTAIKRIILQRIRETSIPVAPPNEQERIVNELEELLPDLDAGVAALERAKANLKRYRAAVLKAAVEGKLTAEWRAEHPQTEPASKLLERILIERRQKWEADQLAKFAAAGKDPPKNWKAKYVEPSPPDPTDLPSVPSSWTWAALDSIAQVAGGITKDQKKANRRGMRDVPYLRVANVQRGFLDLCEMKSISASEEDIAELRLEVGDVLFTEGGDRDKLGRGWVWSGEIGECIHQNHIFRGRLYSDQIQPRLVSHHGNTFGKEWFIKAGKQTTNLASINLGILRRFPVPIPPAMEQAEIIAQVDEKLSQIAAAEKQIDASLLRAARLRQSILKQAFEGRLVPQDPRDEPASALLERIAARSDQSERIAKRSEKSRRTRSDESKRTNRRTKGDAL